MKNFEDYGLNDLQTSIWIYDVTDYRIYWANKSAIKLWEATDLDELCHRDFRSGSTDAVQKTLQGFIDDFEKGLTFDRWWRISPKGINKNVLGRLSGIKIECGRTAMMCEVLDSELLNMDVSGVGSASIFSLFDQDGKLSSYNSLFTEQFGYSIKHFGDLCCEETDWSAITTSKELPFAQDMMLKTRNGLRWHRVELRQQINDIVGHNDFTATIVDIHNRKEKELMYMHDSLSDSLTGLLNRRGLQDQLNDNGNKPYTLFYIDLDGFKPVNDSFGHAIGDLLLQSVAERLVQNMGDKAVFSRIGGDEFVVVIQEEIDESRCRLIANAIVADLSEPMDIEGKHRVVISASVGASMFPEDGEDLNSLLANADAAMYLAKKRGRNRWIRYSKGMEEHLRRRTLIAQSLTNAINNDDLSLHYQPIIDSGTGKVAFAESLLRWVHPTLGPVPPQEIILTAEETGKIVAIESWIIRRACKDLPRLRKCYGSQCIVSINISGAAVTDETFSKRLVEIIFEEGLKPADVMLELTENILVIVLESGQNSLDLLEKAGFSIAIDDFGTGYSSLAYLSQIPANYVKIDKSFVDNINRDYHIVHFIRDLCEKLQMKCIAEGIEELPQAEALDGLGIPLHQGYYYSKPKGLDVLEKSSANNNK